MEVTTFQPKKQSNISTVLIYILAAVGIGLIVYLGINVLSGFGGIGGKSALSVSVLDGDAEVYLDGEYLGATPFDSDEIKPGENTIRIENEDTSYDATIRFLGSSGVVLNRDLGISDVFSSGQNFWMEKADLGTVLSVVSEPSGAKVFVDNTEVGTTPYSTGDLSDGEYELRAERAGFEAQTARIKIQQGFKLNVVIKMFPLPVPATVSLLEGSADLFDVHSSEALVTADASSWAKAVVYWNRTRGINLSGAGVNKELVFDYFVDYGGRVYDSMGVDITGTTDLGEVTRGAYLRRAPDGPGISESAQEAIEALSMISGKKATILATGTGWLNVRSAPGLTGEILQTVNVGDSFTVLEEGTGWLKIRISPEVEGWVSSTYVEVN